MQETLQGSCIVKLRPSIREDFSRCRRETELGMKCTIEGKESLKIRAMGYIWLTDVVEF